MRPIVRSRAFRLRMPARTLKTPAPKRAGPRRKKTNVSSGGRILPFSSLPRAIPLSRRRRIRQDAAAESRDSLDDQESGHDPDVLDHVASFSPRSGPDNTGVSSGPPGCSRSPCFIRSRGLPLSPARAPPTARGLRRSDCAVGPAAEEAERGAAHATLAGAHAGARVQLRLARRAEAGEAAERHVLAAADDRVGAARGTQLVPQGERAGQPRGEAGLPRAPPGERLRGRRPAAARPAMAPVTSAWSTPAIPHSSPAAKTPARLVRCDASTTTLAHRRLAAEEARQLQVRNEAEAAGQDVALPGPARRAAAQDHPEGARVAERLADPRARAVGDAANAPA